VNEVSGEIQATRADGFLAVEQRKALGRSARKRMPRSALGDFERRDEARDPLEVLRADDDGRVAELVPIRYGRMLTTPFAFFRGAASLMANDLAAASRTDLVAQLCGDAHLSNFGLFAAPDRRLVFDCNDFDETLEGPFEWDLKRLVASIAIAARSIGASEEEADSAVLAASAGYRERLRELSKMTNLKVWHQRVEVDDVARLLEESESADDARLIRKAAEKAYTRDSMREFRKLTTVVDGRRRIISDPPLITPIEELGQELGLDIQPETIRGLIDQVLTSYRSTLLADRRQLLDQYELVHVARKVVGVGSVGTRAWIALLIGRDTNDPLFLQVKEAGRSVYEPYLGDATAASSGERVIDGQRLMQGASDPLLGWVRMVGVDGVERDYYVRQLKDWKGSAKIERLAPAQLAGYGELCARVLARAHARSGDRVAIAAYVGKGDSLDRAMASFAASYADQNQRDYDRMREAVASGELTVREGL
jgi:uncharacterized protein (DUF2252 family)